MGQTIKEIIEQRKEYFNNCYKDKPELIKKDMLILDEILQSHENELIAKDEIIKTQNEMIGHLQTMHDILFKKFNKVNNEYIILSNKEYRELYQENFIAQCGCYNENDIYCKYCIKNWNDDSDIPRILTTDSNGYYRLKNNLDFNKLNKKPQKDGDN